MECERAVAAAGAVPLPPVVLRCGGVSLLVDAAGPDQPQILHWGADLGDLAPSDAAAAALALRGPTAHGAQDVPVRRGLIPEAVGGYRCRPGLSVLRRGRGIAPRLNLISVEHAPETGSDPARLTVTCGDPDAGLATRTELVLDAHGVLRVRNQVANTGGDQIWLGELNVTLPLPPIACEIADFTGRWSGERAAQRLPVRFGAWARENRRGRTSAGSAFVTMVGTSGFRHRSGQVWAAHVAWSGNQSIRVEADPDGTRVITAGELLEADEMVLAPGESYTTPWVHATYSDAGVDGISRRLHGSIRSRASHPRTPRPVVLNTWEAVYFDHDLATLTRLAKAAAEVGVERFVLDDGWFGDRRDDTRALGDWVESPTQWPGGLGPLVDTVHGLGMQFGLWVEPEMVNPDSDLYRAHPDWVLADPARLPPLARHQYVLDVARPEVADHLFDRLDALVKRYDIAFLKWDHNRDVPVPEHGGRPGVHAQTVAVYALLDRLRVANPGLEIESCASGGSRVDLGILEHTDRVWASDCNDALERQWIQRGTRVLLPLELIGCHVGPPRSHTTSRVQDLSFRAATALFGHLGIEWDIASASTADRAAMAAVVAQYKRLRPLLHRGDLVTVDLPDPSASLYGVVSADRSHAVFCYAQLTTSRYETPVATAFSGLDSAMRYAITLLAPVGPPRVRERQPAPWTLREGFQLGGAALSTTGLALPILEPEQALLLEFTAT